MVQGGNNFDTLNFSCYDEKYFLLRGVKIEILELSYTYLSFWFVPVVVVRTPDISAPFAPCLV
jgi:hypothetical protein